MSITIRHAIGVSLIVISVLLLQAYLYVQGWFTDDKGLAVAQCNETDQQTSNPHAALFVSCGGFFE